MSRLLEAVDDSLKILRLLKRFMILNWKEPCMNHKRNWFSGKILRCHPSNVGEPWVRFPDHASLLPLAKSVSFLSSVGVSGSVSADAGGSSDGVSVGRGCCFGEMN